MAEIHISRIRQRERWQNLIFAAVLGLSSYSLPANADDWVIGGAEAATPPVTFAPPGQVRVFTIPPQPLETALDAYADATGVQIFYSSRLAANHTSAGIAGTLSPGDALRGLLAGSGLVPRVTGRNAITLVLDPQGIVLASAFTSKPSIDAPMLSLDTLHVVAPPAGNLRLYAATVQYAIMGALQRDQGLKLRSYRAVIDVWLSPAGTVRFSQISASGGDQELDGTIVRIVRNVDVGEAPPINLPQPVHVTVLAARRRF